MIFRDRGPIFCNLFPSLTPFEASEHGSMKNPLKKTTGLKLFTTVNETHPGILKSVPGKQDFFELPEQIPFKEKVVEALDPKNSKTKKVTSLPWKFR